MPNTHPPGSPSFALADDWATSPAGAEFRVSIYPSSGRAYIELDVPQIASVPL